MLKTGSKRSRTKTQIEEEKLTELQKENAIRTKLAMVDQLQAEKEQAQMLAQNNRDAAVLMSDLINAKIV